MPLQRPFELGAVLASLHCEDKIFTNEVVSQWSTKRWEGFETYSERFRRNYGDGYKVDRL